MVLLEELQWHLSIGLDHSSHGILLCGVVNDVNVDAIVVGLKEEEEEEEDKVRTK